MGAYFRKYATSTAAGTHIGIPMPKAGSPDFATGSDWTPAAGDVKVSIDGGAQANITTLPSYSNGQWLFQFSAAELTGKSIRVVIVDSATKAVDDQFFVIETFGHASAMYQVDFTDGAAFGLSRLDAAVSTRSTYAGGAVASVTGAVGSVTAPVTVGTNNDKAGYALTSAYDPAKTAAQVGSAMTLATDSVNANALAASAVTELAAGVLTSVLTEAYASLGATPTLSQLLFEVRALLAEKAMSGTTLTTKKLDGSTVATTYTLDDATNPTSITRAS